jgi:hypothetical protein
VGAPEQPGRIREALRQVAFALSLKRS